MKAHTLVSHVTLKEGQRIITSEVHRIGAINILPYDVTVENDKPVLVLFDDQSFGWIRPSHLIDYRDN